MTDSVARWRVCFLYFWTLNSSVYPSHRCLWWKMWSILIFRCLKLRVWKMIRERFYRFRCLQVWQFGRWLARGGLLDWKGCSCWLVRIHSFPFSNVIYFENTKIVLVLISLMTVFLTALTFQRKSFWIFCSIKSSSIFSEDGDSAGSLIQKTVVFVCDLTLESLVVFLSVGVEVFDLEEVDFEDVFV